MTDTLATLVGSRICHDLISPIGAIGNGVELLSLTDGDTTAEMELITQSVESANARIRYFRVAFGAASTDQNVRRSEILSILSASARGGRFSYMWQAEDPLSRLNVRVAFLAMQCLENALPAGGDISVDFADNTWSVTGSGARVEPISEHWVGLETPESAPDYTAAQVQFALLPLALKSAGRTLEVETTDAMITMRF